MPKTAHLKMFLPNAVAEVEAWSKHFGINLTALTLPQPRARSREPYGLDVG